MAARLLSFDGAAENDPAVTAWFEQQWPDEELPSIARRWFAALRACGPDVRELLHDGCPVACLQDVPFGHVNVFRAHVDVGFFHGASLPDPARLLVGAGRFMRHVKLKPGRPVDEAALAALVAAAYADIQVRVNARL